MPRLVHPCFADHLRSVVLGDQRRRVTPLQWRTLGMLRERFGAFVAYGFLTVGSPFDPLDGVSMIALRVQISRLRRALGGGPFAIATAQGFGYGLFPADRVLVERLAGTHEDERRLCRLRPDLT